MRKKRYTIEDWRAVRRALDAGGTIRGVAEQAGVNRGAVFRWRLQDEPPERMWLMMGIDRAVRPSKPGRSAKARLTYEDRVIIFAKIEAGATHSEAAAAVGCHRTTVSRELARMPGGRYDPRVAQRRAEAAARRPKARKLDASPRLRGYVARSLEERWSPEQIAERIALEFPDDEEMRVSHETIYQALYLQGYGTLRHELGVLAALRSGRKGRKPQSKLPPRGKPWVEGSRISDRPAEAADRAVPGHWEGDLIVGGDKSSCLVTLVERRSRFLLMSRLLAHDAETVERKLEEMVAGLPAQLAKTLTWDQGSEMARASAFELATGFEVYFCDPHSPWQRPTNENTNGLIREFFPKGTRFSEVTDEEVAYAQRLLNNRPRKVLGWKKPAEAMQEVLVEGAMTA